ncbi:MAG TPA: hypothetical protein PKV72_03865 [Candidatus Peribacteria bacterium]|nr:hypothetical protein [Candidatus Peribacteria bacterium]
MNEKEFAMTDDLRLGAGGVGVERTAADLASAEGLHAFFQTFDATRLAGIEAQFANINAAIGMQPPPAANRRQRHEMRGVHHRLTKWGSVKIREAVALADLAGSVAEGDALHIHDVCGGKGAVALYVAFLRQQAGRVTTGTCWELRADQQQGHEFVGSWLGLTAPPDFRSVDIAHADLARAPDGKTHALAKHACGPLTDAVFANVAALPAHEKPDVTAVMTCCHSYLQGTEPFWPASVPLTDRQEIARRADPQKEPDPYVRDVVGVVCRRVVDALRAKMMGADLREALPFGKESQRNHVLSKA